MLVMEWRIDGLVDRSAEQDRLQVGAKTRWARLFYLAGKVKS